MNYRAFSCPQEPQSTWIGQAIAVLHARAAVEMFLDRHGGVLAEQSSGLVESLRAWLLTDTNFATVWDMAFGRVVLALESKELLPIEVAVALALRLAAVGHQARWAATLTSQPRLLWNMRCLLPPAVSVTVETVVHSTIVALNDAHGVTHAFTFSVGSDSHAGENMQEVGELVLLPGYAVPHDMIVEDSFHSIFDFPLVNAETAQSFNQALTILDRDAPAYRRWVLDVVRGVLICQCDRSRTRSSSWVHAPGIVLASIGDDPIVIAEMLVHEASHQYFHLLSRLGDVDDGSDAKRYYSPAVQHERPLRRILVGYHAFANILLFYRTLCRGRFEGDARCRATEQRMSADVDRLEGPLRQNPALTAIGRDLVEPLMERLRATEAT